MVDFIITGVVLGLSAGIAPGPLLTLVLSETIQYGPGAGIKVAISPIITDLPLIILTLMVFTRLSEVNRLMGGISLLGGMVILFMSYESLNPKDSKQILVEPRPHSLLKGIVANALSPYPYLFWFSVGGPIMGRARGLSAATAFAFLLGFYICLIGSKILLAVVVGHSRSFLKGTLYLSVLRLLGLILLVLAMRLLWDGLVLLGVVGA